MIGCGAKIECYTPSGKKYNMTCGEYYSGKKELCDKCLREAKAAYPQGWYGYPGDTCKHGTYIGGCGADLICGACEGGD